MNRLFIVFPFRFRLILVLILMASPSLAQSQRQTNLDVDRERARSVIADHDRNQQNAPENGFVAAHVQDFGNIAVIEASPKAGTSTPPNKFDLGKKSIQFKRNSDASYLVQVGASPVSSGGGSTILVAPGASKAVKLAFAFPFYHATYKTVFVNAGGSLTLGKAVVVPLGLTESQLFHAAPRIAPLDVASLTAPVEVTVTPGAGQVSFTWAIPFGTTLFRAQAVLFQSGDISFRYDAFPVSTVAITGITPGLSTVAPQSVDFSKAVLPAVHGAAVENFNPNGSIDQVGIAKAFLASHSDTFDFIALFFSVKHPGRPSLPGTGVDVIYQNNIRGIGRTQYNFSKVLGTSGKLKAIASLFDFEAYPPDPHKFFPNTPADLGRTPLELVSHEIGHEWLASIRILENGAKTTSLLSDCCHWSFLFDADGSFMNGNDIVDNGNGTFTTGAPLVRFSNLDQYLMGLIPASGVSPMFYVTAAAGATSTEDARKNVMFSGTRVNVTIDQVVAANGTRVPAFSVSQHSFRVAFILIIDEGRKPTQAELQRLEKLRIAWPSYFQAATSNRLTMNDTLN